MTRLPQLALSVVTPATAYHFRAADDRGGWAIATVNDVSYELNIQSDWGTWARRWHAGGMPKRDGRTLTLSEFLVESLTPDDGYVADKLWPGGGYDGKRFCPERTIEALHRLIARTRLEHGRRLARHARIAPAHSLDLLTARTARRLWQEIEDLDCNASEGVFFAHVWRLELHTFDLEAVINCRQQETDPAYTILRQTILPALAAALRERLAAAAAAPTSTTPVASGELP